MDFSANAILTTDKNKSGLKRSSNIASVLALLALALLVPQYSHAHVSAPVLPEEGSDSTTPEHDHPVTEPDASDAGDSTTDSGQEMIDHSMPDMDDQSMPDMDDQSVQDSVDHSGHDMGAQNEQDIGDQSAQDTGEPAPVRPGMGGHGMGGHGEGSMSMNHPGMPVGWILPIVLVSTAILGWAVGAEPPAKTERKTLNMATIPVLGPVVVFLNASPFPLFVLKVITVVTFILVLISGFFGTVYPERSLATVLVWNWWWPLVVVSVFFVGSAWCAICPSDTLSAWIVRRKLWKRAFPHPGFNRQVPKYLRNVWLALLLFIGLTWLELGIGATSIPNVTAMMALALFSLSFIFLIFFERKAFCRYGCPVGRTIGFYSRLAPIALRPKEQKTCSSCKTMECYRGSDKVEPCPTGLTIGKFSQNTYCLSCGNCVLSCPYENVTWRLRGMGTEATSEAPPTWDGAWFMLILLGITTFHGVTMLPFWTDLVIWIARSIGETGKIVWSFSVGMLGGFALPVIIYAIAIAATMFAVGSRISYKRLFIALPFSTLPLAFTYHLAHNLDHLFREGGGVLALFFNPLGTGLTPMTSDERHAQMINSAPDQLLFAMQAGLIILGIWLAVYILRYRAARLLPHKESIKGWQLIPMLAFIAIMTGANLWLLSQDMVMRF